MDTSHFNIEDFDGIMNSFFRDMSIITFRSSSFTQEFKKSYNDREKQNQTGRISKPDACDVQTGINIPLKLKQASGDKLREEILNAYNTQLCWILVNAYETFEQFVCNLYAILGYASPSIWRCKEFGSHGIDEVFQKQYKWFQEQTQKIQEKKKIFYRLRNKIAGIEELEKNNEEEMNLFAWQIIIKSFRNRIVHYYGVLSENYENKLKADLGGLDLNNITLARKNNSPLALTGFFKKDGNRTKLWLVNQNNMDKTNDYSSQMHVRLLIKYLCSHAALLYRKSVEHFNSAPFWERP